jgi:vesicle transport protein SEC22
VFASASSCSVVSGFLKKQKTKNKKQKTKNKTRHFHLIVDFEKMALQLTLIARLGDGLALCASMENGNETPVMRKYNQRGKDIFAKLSSSSPRQMHLDCPPYYFSYLISEGVVYLTLCQQRYPKRLAVAFLAELAKEFDVQYGAYVGAASRPYEFIRFDTFIQKTKKLYADTESQRNLDRVADDLVQVQRIMSKSLDEVLSRGERLDSVTRKSDRLAADSKRFERLAKNINRTSFLKKYGIAIGALLFIALLFWLSRMY